MSAGTSKPSEDVVHLWNAAGRSEVVLICEHASPFIPDHLRHLGLAAKDRLSHAAWDPGALEVAKHLSKRLDAQLVAGAVSRLVYDCNRPPDAPDAMPTQSELIPVPGNIGLDAAAKSARVTTYYEPFHAAVRTALQTTRTPIIVTVHSFTPVFHGKSRRVEIGVLHDADTRLADALLTAAGNGPFSIQRNQPYGPEDGVTHTLKEHGLAGGHLNVMIEVRSDLIATPDQQTTMAGFLEGWLETALSNVAAARGETCSG